MDTTDAKLTDNPHVLAVAPESIPDATPEQLLNRIHAKLSETVTAVVAAVERLDNIGRDLLHDFRNELTKLAAAPRAPALETQETPDPVARHLAAPRTSPQPAREPLPPAASPALGAERAALNGRPVPPPRRPRL